MKMVNFYLTVCAIFLFQGAAYCQQKDTTLVRKDTIPSFIKGDAPLLQPTRSEPMDTPYKSDSLVRKKHDPRKATLYSAIIPGLGQIYNRKYWKLPLVAAALGIPAYTYFYNKSQYQKSQFALTVIDTYFGDTGGIVSPVIPVAVMNQVDTIFRPFVRLGEDNLIRSYRDEVRKDQDYSVLFFILFWGLQVVDATVDAHLRDFDVSDKLTLRLDPSDGTLSGAKGFCLVLDYHQAKYKPIPLP